MDQPVSTPQPAARQLELTGYWLWSRRVVCLSLCFLGVCVIVTLGTRLYGELGALSVDLADARNREPMGYLGISAEQPEIKPRSCVREQDGRIYLWAGSGVKGQAGWFDVTATDLPVGQFAFAFGRDRVKTIDYPIIQSPDGEIAKRIYPERPVLGIVFNGIVRAYPLTVMEKVEVVNDVLGGRPVAVTYCPLLQKAAAYERSLLGDPISFGTSGYCWRDAFVLYDRRTDSLWYPEIAGLMAITGELAGSLLPHLNEKLEVTTWGQWLRRHPNTEVVVGADRTHGIPLPSKDVATR